MRCRECCPDTRGATPRRAHRRARSQRLSCSSNRRRRSRPARLQIPPTGRNTTSRAAPWQRRRPPARRGRCDPVPRGASAPPRPPRRPHDGRARRPRHGRRDRRTSTPSRDCPPRRRLASHRAAERHARVGRLRLQQTRAARGLRRPHDDDRGRKSGARHERHSRRLLTGEARVAKHIVDADRGTEGTPGIAADRGEDVRRAILGRRAPRDGDERSREAIEALAFARPLTASSIHPAPRTETAAGLSIAAASKDAVALRRSFIEPASNSQAPRSLAPCHSSEQPGQRRVRLQSAGLMGRRPIRPRQLDDAAGRGES